MNPALKDDWVAFGAKMAFEFLTFIEPRDLNDDRETWLDEEICYFCFSYTLWTSKIAYKLNPKTKNGYTIRADTYLHNVSEYFATENKDNRSKLENKVFMTKKDVYFKLLDSGSMNPFRALGGKQFVPAAKQFLIYACIKTPRDEKTILSQINEWLNNKGAEFGQRVPFTPYSMK